mgnify:CR=1 FL=1
MQSVVTHILFGIYRHLLKSLGRWVFCLLLLLCSSGFAQTEFHFTDNADSKLQSDVTSQFQKARLNPADSLGRMKELRRCRELLLSRGYLEASADSLVSLNGVLHVYWTCGPQYQWATLRTNNDDEDLLASAGVRDRLFRKKVFTPLAFAKLNADILKWCTNNGFPFAAVALDSVSTSEGKISAVLKIDRGPLVLMDTLVVKGNAKISPAYLNNYLSLKPGEPFDESLMRKISIRLKELPFLTEARSPEVEFTSSRARPVIYLQAKKASQVNGVVGVQPDNAGSGKVFVTGDVRLRLLNSFGKAELLDLNWSNPLPRSQDLKLKFSYPFLFSLPVGVEGDLALFKKDSVFLEINRQVAFRYFFAGNNSFRLFLGRKTSDLISTKGYENITTLPSFADVGANTFGLGVQFQRLDYRLNPRKGYALDLSAGAGVRTIEKNGRLNPVVYDSLDLRNTQYKAEGMFDVYFPLFARSVINVGAAGGWQQSDNIFSNELFRFGGLKSLRGFDELSLNASSYVIGKAEFRFILEQNSYLLLFYNQAWYEDKSREELLSDTPFGYGAGITFETKLGIFSFTYALGSQQGNPVEFRSAKVHFGLVNYF